jgi:TonB-linked SusC/RagA family outer membrane protein
MTNTLINGMKNAKLKKLVDIMTLSAFLLLMGVWTASARGGDSSETFELQQSKTRITGTIVDTDGEPVIGANIVEKGVAANGTITDADGKFSLNVSQGATLVVSYIGYVTQEIAVTGSVLNVIMTEDLMNLEEVVVVGYGTVRKEAVTGAVARANLETFKDVPTNNILEKVKGTIAGLNVDGTNRAGAVAGMIIRGQNSTAASNSPLIVVDGVIFAGSLADISTYDIESFTVLKDASAAAIYGSRSANGVILIETKRGAGVNGKPVFNANVNYGISNELEHLKVYTGDAYLQRLLDIRAANDLEADPSLIEIYLQDEERKNYTATPDHRPTMPDPYDVFNQTGYNRNASFSVANRTDKLRYYIASSVISQRGVMIRDQYKSFTGRINIDNDVTDWLNIGIKSFYSFRDNSGASPGRRMTQFSPWASLYDENGDYMYAPQTTTTLVSPFWEMATHDLKHRNNLNGIVTATIKVPWIEGLSFTSTLSNTLYWEKNNQFWDTKTTTGRPVNGTGFREVNDSHNLLWDNILKYNRTFKEKHYVDVTMLFSQEKYASEQVRATAQDFDNLTLQDYRLEDGKTQKAETGGSASESLGLMARGTYTYNGKYSLTGTIRRDGYSAFSKNKKYGTFPSVGVNWNISRENFMQNISYLNNLALRATYGTNGNQSISRYQTLAKISTDKYIYAGSSSYAVTQYINSLATDDLGWESTTGLNLGIDFGWLDNRINGAIDLYQTRTNNQLFSLALPRISGMGSITSNVGEIQNRGIEINLNTLNVNNRDFKWESSASFSLNRNKVVTILGEDNDGDGKEDDLISSGYFIGRTLGTIYNYKILGMYQQADVDNGTIMTGWRPGEYILEDLDESGTITSDKDRQILGSSKENFRWSFTNTFRYKGFSLMVYLYSIWGGNDWYLADNSPYNTLDANRGDLNHPVYDYWTPTNTGAQFPRPDYGRGGAVKGTTYIDRSFIKLQKMSLTYDVGRWVKSWGIRDLTVGVSADNLFTYAPHWIGLDPETNSGLSDTAIPSIRTYNFSVAINF